MVTIKTAVRDWLQVASSARARPYLLVAFLVDSSFLFVFLVILQTYLPERYGASSALAGYALAAYGGAKLLTQFTSGDFIDRAGARKALRTGLALIALAQLSLLVTPSWPPLAYPAALVYGFGGAIVWPALYALTGSNFAAEERGRLTSALTLTSAAAASAGLGLGILLPRSFPYTGALVLVLLAAVAALATTSTFADTRLSALALPRQSVRAGFSAALSAFRGAASLALALTILCESAAIAALLSVFRAIGRDQLGVSLRTEALYCLPAVAAYATALLAGGVASDRLARWPVLALGLGLAGASVMALSWSYGRQGILPLALAAAGLGLSLPSLSAMSIDLAPGPIRGKLIASFFACEGLGHTLGPAAAAAIGLVLSTAAVLRFSAGAFLAGAIVCLLALSVRTPSPIAESIEADGFIPTAAERAI